MHDGTGFRNLLERPQGCPQYRKLMYHVLGQAQSQPKRVLDRRNARDTYSSGQFRHHGKRDGTEAGGFDFTLNQSHGPAADRSNGNQQYCIHLFPEKLGDDAKNCVTQQRIGPKRIAHV